MTNSEDLLDRIIDAENNFKKSSFISPVIPGASVKVRIHGLVYELNVSDRNYKGWAILKAIDDKTAKVVGEPDIDVVKKYLGLFPAIRMVVIGKPDEYVAMPIDIGNKLGITQSGVIHLCDDEPQQFDYIVARYNGVFWYDDVDTSRDPMIADEMRQALDSNVATPNLKIKGMSNVDKMVYGFAYDLKVEEQKRIEAERRKKLLKNKKAMIHDSVELSGGKVNRIDSVSDYYSIKWELDGEEQNIITVNRKSMRIQSAGVCIENAGENFDLRSLVSAIKTRKKLMELEGEDTSEHNWHVGSEKAKRKEHGLK